MKHDNETIDQEGFLLVKDNWTPKGFTGKVKRKDGDKEWYKNGQLHRIDGPAIVKIDGTTYWCKNDKLHREDGPAVKWSIDHCEWWYEGRLHRSDGPAIKRVDGIIEWWYRGKHGLENFPPELKKKLTRKFIHET